MHILDLSETRKVWEFAEAFKKKYKTLNVLVSDLLSFTPYRHKECNWCINELTFYELYFTLILQINNAGSVMIKREVNAEGIEKSFASNSLGE